MAAGLNRKGRGVLPPLCLKAISNYILEQLQLEE